MNFADPDTCFWEGVYWASEFNRLHKKDLNKAFKYAENAHWRLNVYVHHVPRHEKVRTIRLFLWKLEGWMQKTEVLLSEPSSEDDVILVCDANGVEDFI